MRYLGRIIVNSKGECSPCDDYYKSTEDLSKCFLPKCEAGEVLSDAAKCSSCQPYFGVSENGRECIPVTCKQD